MLQVVEHLLQEKRHRRAPGAGAGPWASRTSCRRSWGPTSLPGHPGPTGCGASRHHLHSPFTQEECLAIFSKLLKRGILKIQKLPGAPSRTTDGEASRHGGPNARLDHPDHCLCPGAAGGGARTAQAQVNGRPASGPDKKLTAERDESRTASRPRKLQETWPPPRRAGTWRRQETDSVRKELDQDEERPAENQGSSDTILKELQKTKADLAATQAANEPCAPRWPRPRRSRSRPSGKAPW